MVIKVRSFCLLVMLMTIKAYAQAVPTDSLEQWLGKFSEVRLQEISPDGKRVVLNKVSAIKNDTVMIFDTSRQTDPVILPGSVNTGFLKNGNLLTYSSGRADLRRSEGGILQSYGGIRQYDILKKNGRYALYDRSDRLHLYDPNGTVLGELENVKRYITDQSELIYAEQNDAESSTIYKIGMGKPVKVYSTSYLIERMELSEFRNHLVIYEKDRSSDRRRLVVIDRNTDAVDYPLGTDLNKYDFSTFKEIRNARSALIKVVRFQRTSTGNVDIYYGNDQDLRSVMDGRKAIEEYWLWNNTTKTIRKLDLGEKRSIADIGNATCFLNFNGNELRDYLHHRPFLKISLYNSETQTNYSIGIIQPQLIASVTGHYLLYQLEDASWEMLEISTKKRTAIRHSDLRNPVFTTDDARIYFESEDGLWQYHISAGNLVQLHKTGGSSIRIINAERHFLSQGYSIYHSTIDPDRSLIVEAKDTADTVRYLSVKKDKVNQHFLTTRNQVSNFLYADRSDRWCWVEENYNMPPVLNFSGNSTSSKILFDDGEHDLSVKEIRQEMISDRLLNGNELKGILYYPQHFDPSQKYPMIVHIYQVQHTKNKEYLLPKYDALGFNIRILLEKGYFVYLPDLVNDSRGPGVAGLESINAALDALERHKNINWSKIGLIGHSFGGYLTDFISTRSNRFAAYISGSGVSDIIQSYYSLNRNFPGPHYWQLENGQYQMNESFTENKDLYFNNNPIYQAEQVSAPILLWSGRKDENVVSENIMSFYLALKRNHKNVIALLYEKSGHSLTDNDEQNDLNRKALEWWDYFLKDQKAIPWIDRQMKKDAH